MKLSQLSLTVAALFIAASASAAAPKLGIVYDAGGKFDKSFNQSAFEGASRFKKETNISFIEVQASSDTQAEQVLRGLARKNLDLIASIGFAQQQAVQKVAKEFPKVHFVLIDGVAQGANVNSITFKEEEGSYLVGVAAAMASKSKKLGFIGGIDIPLIRTFSCGYAQGAKAVNPKGRGQLQHGRHHLRLLEQSRPRAGNWRARSSTAASTWCLPWPAVRAWARCRPPRKKASWRSAWTRTRTTCIRARC
jgi:basic membrane protein A